MIGEPLYALNFYSPIVENQLRSGRKSATIRLGDKSSKYRKGMIVAVLAGARFSPRKKIFDAVVDKVEVKTLGELSPNEIEHDNPEIRRVEEMAQWLGTLYNRDVSESDLVTVIRFSEIRASVLTTELTRLLQLRAAARSLAPMAGGPTTPELVAAVTEAGGLGMFAGSGACRRTRSRRDRGDARRRPRPVRRELRLIEPGVGR